MHNTPFSVLITLLLLLPYSPTRIVIDALGEREREREIERSLFATLDIHNCMTNNINITCGRLPEKG